jgi:uncharacterized membrane protein YgcG
MDKLKYKLNQLFNKLRQYAHQLHKEQTVENNNNIPTMYTEEQLMARLKFFIGICLSLTLFGIVFVVLYSLIFVTQPLNAISPIDQKFFELIVPIATFLTGTLSGIMLAGGDKDAQAAALKSANAGWERPPTPTPTNSGNNNGSATSFGASTPAATSSFGSPVSAGGFGSVPSTGGFGSPSSFGGGGFGSVLTTASGKKIVPDEPQPLV